MFSTLAVAAAMLLQREYLTEVVSPPVEVAGTAAEIAAKGRRCMASQLASGTAGGELIVSDSDNTIVARSVIEYPDGLLKWTVRSRVTFEARDGRFRISQTGLERFNDQGGGWSGIGKWRFSGWERAERAFTESAAAISACVTAKADDW